MSFLLFKAIGSMFMDEVKGLMQSKTVWGCIVTILCMILMQFGIEVDEGSKLDSY